MFTLLNMRRAFHFILLIVFLSACGSQSKSTSVGCDIVNKAKKIKLNKACSKKEYYQQVLILKINQMFKGKSIGILFIVLGLIFLFNNLNLIEVSLAELIRVYWPVILIWLGVDKLLRKSINEDKKD